MSGLWKDEVFGALALALYRRTGLVFEGGQAQLFRKRVQRRSAELGYPTVKQYAAALGCRGDGEYEVLVDLLTVNETYFFREEEHYRALLSELWPEWERARDGPIRVWSAGCSTGCEAHTLGILLRERGLVGPGRAPVDVVGTDITARVLEDARAGLYGDFALRSVTPYFRQKYFTKEGNLYRLAPAVLELATFRKVNLIDLESLAVPGRFHVIFCRNVLIYFDLEAKRKVVEVLTRALRPGGVLVIGRSESLFGIAEAPPLENIGGTLMHRKRN